MQSKPLPTCILWVAAMFQTRLCHACRYMVLSVLGTRAMASAATRSVNHSGHVLDPSPCADADVSTRGLLLGGASSAASCAVLSPFGGGVVVSASG